MREIRIYQPGEFRVDQILDLSPDAAHHVGVVLRMQRDDQLTLFDGDGRELKACIVEAKKKQVSVRIESVTLISRESPLLIHLAQAISKGDRMDFVMQKAAELGVASVTPIISERCAIKLDPMRLVKKVQQWQAIVISACEQSGRTCVPVVNAPLSLDEFVNKVSTQFNLVLDPRGPKRWRDFNVASSLAMSLLVGPEGGFSDEEIQLIVKHGFEAWVLGPRILRTETAAIAALSILQALAGDL